MHRSRAWLLSFAYASVAAALSGLDRPRGSFLLDVLAEGGASQKSCKPTGMIQDACCHFEEVESLNERLSHALSDIVKEPFFRYHKVDLYRDCPFWQEDSFCGNRACAVDWMDESHIPETLRSGPLGELRTPSQGAVPSSLTDGCRIADSDFCVLEENNPSDSIYIDLVENPERFTGYTGHSAHKVWKAIYEENCFGVVPYLPPASSKKEGGTGFVSDLGRADLRSLMGSLAGPRDPSEEMCLEKRVFYRLISGLHASISIHICDEYLDQQTGEWSPNLECFISRIAEHPERLQNVYFDYVLLLRAFEKGAAYFAEYDVCTGDEEIDARTKAAFKRLSKEAQTCPSTFDESTMFTGSQAHTLKAEFKDHFRNISRIMDCVGCDKCRLWGKLQVTGLGTALKLLFSYEDDAKSPGLTLQRSELVAFVNTLHRFSESLAAIDRFRKLWAERDAKAATSSPRIEPIAPPPPPIAQAPPVSLPAQSDVPLRGPEHRARYKQPDMMAKRGRGKRTVESYGKGPNQLPPQQKSANVFASSHRSTETAALGFFDALRVVCQVSWNRCTGAVFGRNRGQTMREPPDLRTNKSEL